MHFVFEFFTNVNKMLLIYYVVSSRDDETLFYFKFWCHIGIESMGLKLSFGVIMENTVSMVFING